MEDAHVPERQKRYRRIEMTDLEMELFGLQGHEPVWAVIQTSLTFLEIERINGDDLTFRELWEVMTPYIVAWNARGIDPATQNWSDVVPAPEEAGWEVFKAVPPEVWQWIKQNLCIVAIGGQDRKNVLRELEASDAPTDATSSSSPAPSKPSKSSPRRRKGSDTP